ncbi:hypothetical protein FLA105535_01894 [Flavobacterium bizetiae]|nr:hypothetical protein FLA105535_01894 [Flavobacterium bizetiae]
MGLRCVRRTAVRLYNTLTTKTFVKVLNFDKGLTQHEQNEVTFRKTHIYVTLHIHIYYITLSSIKPLYLCALETLELKKK